MENPYLRYAGSSVGPDGHTYTCSAGVAAIPPQGAEEIELRDARDPNARLITPTGARITQMAITLAQPLHIGIPSGLVALMRSRQTDANLQPAIALQANTDGMIARQSLSCLGLWPGETRQFFRPESFSLAILGEAEGPVIQTADQAPGLVFVAIWYASPIHPPI